MRISKLVVVIVLLIVLFPDAAGRALNQIVPPAVRDAYHRIVDDMKKAELP